MSPRQIVTAAAWRDAAPEARSALGVGGKPGCLDDATPDAIKALLLEMTEEERHLCRAAGGDPDNADRTLPWVFSTEARDRDGDRIKVSGWKLTDYRKNPVVLFAHNSRDIPIGRSLRTWRDTDRATPALRGLIQFTERELGNGFGHMIFELAKAKYLRSGSVGFMPIKWTKDPELGEGRYGVLFEEQGLLEFSPTPVPSNPEALSEAKSVGIDLSPYSSWTERVLDGEEQTALWVPRAAVETVRKIATGAPVSVVVEQPPEPEPEPAITPAPSEPAPLARLMSAVLGHIDAVERAAAGIDELIEGLDEIRTAKIATLSKLESKLEGLLGMVRDSRAGLEEPEPAADPEPEAQGRDPYAGAEHLRPRGINPADLLSALRR